MAKKVNIDKEEQDLIEKTLNIMASNFGVWLKEKRGKKEMSGRELARQSKVSSAVISDIECFKYLPKMEVLLKLISVLGISVKELLNALWKPVNEESCNFTINDNEMDNKINNSDQQQKPPVHPLQIVQELLKEYGLTANDIDEVTSYISYKKFMRQRRNARLPRTATKMSEITKK